jgi:acetoin utilization protein AcuB
MTREVITVQEDIPIEEAARVMADSKISGLPVMQKDRLVGLITETDLFKIFLEMFGARFPGVRISVEVNRGPGQLAKITNEIFSLGGDIVSLGTFMGESTTTGQITMKVDGVAKDRLVAAVTPHVLRIIDVREG